MSEINLIKIDGKPLEKLIDVVSKGIGTIYRPRSIRKDAEAKVQFTLKTYTPNKIHF